MITHKWGLSAVFLVAFLTLPNAARSELSPEVTSQQIKRFIDQNSMWRRQGQRLIATFSFKGGFSAAVNFVQSLVEPADRMNHHPDLKITYNRVEVSLTTHDAGGLTKADLELAKIIQSAFETNRKEGPK